MSGGQQGGPMMGGGKGGTQQMPSGGKGGPQGHMMPNGQQQVRPGMGGPMGGNMGQPQPPQVSQWHGGGLPQAPAGTMPNFSGFTGGGMPQGPAAGVMPMPNMGGQQQGMPGQQPAQFQHQMAAMNSGTPGPQYQPQQQPRQLSGLLAKLYGG